VSYGDTNFFFESLIRDDFFKMLMDIQRGIQTNGF